MQLLQLSQHTCSGGYGWRNSLVREKVYCGSLKGGGLSFGFDCRQAWQFTFTHQTSAYTTISPRPIHDLISVNQTIEYVHLARALENPTVIILLRPYSYHHTFTLILTPKPKVEFTAKNLRPEFSP